jgi:hypothetical protein
MIEEANAIHLRVAIGNEVDEVEESMLFTEAAVFRSWACWALMRAKLSFVGE